MKILMIPDVEHWAIGKLSKSIIKHNGDLDIKMVYIHPRDAEEKESIDKIKADPAEFKKLVDKTIEVKVI